MINLIERLNNFKDNAAIIDERGEYSYQQLLNSSSKIASFLLQGQENLRQARVAFIIPSSFEYISTMLGIWRAGGVAVPLCTSHPDPELDYVIKDSVARIIIAHPEFENRLRELSKSSGAQFYTLEKILQSEPGNLPDIDASGRAMIVYTSGTTSKPKGVVTTHANIEAQIISLVEAWGWVSTDYILNVLALHHVHGIVNVLLCALWSGAKCEMMPKFDVESVWQKFIDRDLSVFMAVPTIYSRLIKSWDEASSEKKETMSSACKKIRLMVSGSAALPVSVLEKWHEISGHVLLERYGMTEIGMALSNPLCGERVPGHVGKPLPGVEIKLDGEEIEGQGEILVRGPSVFIEYWRRPEATKNAFTEDGWFKTGDIASVNDEMVYKILGRDSVDIIKSGGYKISALEIEEVLRQNPEILDCAVVGVEDTEWGERVCAAIVLSNESNISHNTIRDWCKERLAPYKVPSEIVLLKELPKNSPGKVIKPKVSELFAPKN